MTYGPPNWHTWYFYSLPCSAVARANEVRGHYPNVGGTKINWTFAYKNWSSDLVRLQICATLKVLYSKLKNSIYIRPAAFLSWFRLRPIIAWKIYLQQWILPKTQQGLCLEGWIKSKFLLRKNIVRFWFRAKQTDATQACHRRGWLLNIWWLCSGNYCDFAANK